MFTDALTSGLFQGGARPSTSPPRGRVIAFLEQAPEFARLSPPDREALADQLSWWTAPGRTRIVTPGAPCDALCVVFSGGLRLSPEVADASEDAAEPAFESLGAGDVLGLAELLEARPFSCFVHAARDTELASLSASAAKRFAEAHPYVWEQVARGMSRRSSAHKSRVPLGITVAVLYTSADPALATFTGAFTEALANLASVAVVDAASFERAANDTAPGVWLDDLERRNTYVVYVANPTRDAWTERCLRQADRVLVIARATADSGLTPVEAGLYAAPGSGHPPPVDLVLLQEPETVVPSGTSDWLAWRSGVHRVLHVRVGDPAHVGRVARLLTGRSVGLVCGGGGARGTAHIGVIQALRELGVPVDIAGGTSAGGGIAAMLSAERSPERIRADCGHAFVTMAPFSAYDVPWTSLMHKDRVEAPAKWLFGDLNVEDLWLPFFCVACDLAAARKVIFEQGRVWKALRATTALPGILPPLYLRGRVLVDGGILDNTPIEAMRERHGGPNILVNVSPPDPDLVDDLVVELPPNRSVLMSYLHPLLSPVGVPAIPALVVRTMTVASTNVHQEHLAELYLAPDIAAYGIVDFEALDELAALGYNATMAAFEARRGDLAFLAAFHLRPEHLPDTFPRVEVPVWQSRQRARRATRRRILNQTVVVCVIGSVVGVATHSLVALEWSGVGAVLGLLVAAVPTLRHWLAAPGPA